MTCHWIRPTVRHIGILHLVSISTTSPQWICHSAPVSEVLSKSDHPRQKKMTSCQFSRWRISAILNFRGPVMDSSRSQAHVRLPIGRSSTETIPLNCLLFFRKSLFCILATDRQTNGQTDGHHRCVKPQSRYRELRLNNVVLKVSSTSVQLCNIMKIKWSWIIMPINGGDTKRIKRLQIPVTSCWRCVAHSLNCCLCVMTIKKRKFSEQNSWYSADLGAFNIIAVELLSCSLSKPWKWKTSKYKHNTMRVSKSYTWYHWYFKTSIPFNWFCFAPQTRF